jgi:hypothetical protein
MASIRSMQAPASSQALGRHTQPLAKGEEDRARDVLAHARTLGEHGEALQEEMMECMRESTRLTERARRGGRLK